jgi:hypothetical protein
MTHSPWFSSRAETILPTGITPKVLRARTTKSVAEIRKRIEQLSAPYEEVDNSIRGAVQVLTAAFDQFEERIKETQRYLDEAL